MVAPTLPKKAMKQSMQEDGVADGLNFLFNMNLLGSMSEFIAPWGTPKRESQLRRLYYDYDMLFPVSAIVNLSQQLREVNYSVSGGRNNANYYNELFSNMQFGLGWDRAMSMILQDLFVQDQGAFIEVIAAGKPDTPIRRRVTGLAHLDSLRCYLTGNREFPVVYMNTKGALHKVHHTRVIHLVLNPHPDPEKRGRGLSLMSRALAVARTSSLVLKYQYEQLENVLPQGLLAFKGMSRKQLQQAQEQYYAQQELEGQSVFKNTMEFASTDPDNPIGFDYLQFSQMPAQSDFATLLNGIVNMLAMAIGIDPQDIWPLSGQMSGTATQSETLHEKGKGKTYKGVQTLLERVFNHQVLPRAEKFEFKSSDHRQNKAEAELARSWGFFTSTMVDRLVLDTNEARALLSNTVAQISDIVLDENGELIRTNSIDPETEEQLEAKPSDNIPPAPEVANVEEKAKTAQSTRLDFEGEFEDLVTAAREGNITKARFRIALRSMLRKFINRHYGDGLEDGGVDRNELSSKDRSTIRRLILDATPHVRRFSDEIYNGISAAMATSRIANWYNGSLKPAYAAGLVSANRNGMYEWVQGNTIEPCDDCRRLNGQVHRLKDWMRVIGFAGTVGQKTKCGGNKCKCRYVLKKGARASGRY